MSKLQLNPNYKNERRRGKQCYHAIVAANLLNYPLILFKKEVTTMSENVS